MNRIADLSSHAWMSVSLLKKDLRIQMERRWNSGQ